MTVEGMNGERCFPPPEDGGELLLGAGQKFVTQRYERAPMTGTHDC